MTDVSDLPLAETVFEEVQPELRRERDRIVILGRRAAGKTVYLAVLYEKYWKSLGPITMKAVSGNVHSDLIRTVEGLRTGNWPPATLETQHRALAIRYRRRKYVLVAMDYAGELFRKAFVEDVTDTPETSALVEHIDSAAAVMLLVDPSVVVSGDVDAKIDDDFGMTQAVARIRNWPGGRDIPFVLVFTKADQYEHLLDREGGMESFVAHHFPGLARTLKKTYIFKVAAVQVEALGDGTTVPVRHFSPHLIEAPLLHCLDQLDLQREIAKEEALQRRRARNLAARVKAERKATRRFTFKLAAVIVAMILAAASIVAYIWIVNT